MFLVNSRMESVGEHYMECTTHAAGLDIGSEEMWSCVPEDRDPQPVRSFGTFTPDLYALRFALKPRCVRCGPICVIVQCCSTIARPISSTCRRPCSRCTCSGPKC